MEYKFYVPSVGTDTPLPDLNIVVDDGDTSENAEYELVLEHIQNSRAEGVFTVYPQRAIGRYCIRYVCAF